MILNEFDAVFDRAQQSAFRLETLPRYADDEGEEFAAFLASGPLPERSTQTVPWLRRVADTTAAGVRWLRVHVLNRPLTDYLRFEMVGYEANVDAGEEVRIADVGSHPELATLRDDFWLFDAETPKAFAMLMQFDPVGHLIGFEVTDDPQVIKRCQHDRDVAVPLSVPLDVYTATLDA
jgi:hypothetical protein